MKKVLIFIGIFAFITTALGVYFFTRNNNAEDLITKENQLENDLAIAQNKLNKEKDILENMTSDLQNSFALAFSVQEQMKQGSDIISQTDFMFTDPNGLNPELIIKNFSTILLINKERREINLLLQEWQNKNDILFIKKIDKKESEKIKKDAEKIKSYLQDLSYLVGILTPENSGISQYQIDIYLASLPLEDAINQVLASLQNAIDNSQTLNNQISIDSSPSVSLVTPDDVVAQQHVVEQIQNQVIALQEQLTQTQNQIQQLSSNPTPVQNSETNSDASSNTDTTPTVVDTTPTSSPTDSNPSNNSSSTEIDIDTQINSDSSNQIPNTNSTDNSNDETNPDDYIVNNNSGSNDHEGIIIQPGPVQLIQGSNQY